MGEGTYVWRYGKNGDIRPLKTGKAATRQEAVSALIKELDLTDPQARGFKLRDSLVLVDHAKADYCEVIKARTSWNPADLRRLQARSQGQSLTGGSTTRTSLSPGWSSDHGSQK